GGDGVGRAPTRHVPYHNIPLADPSFLERGRRGPGAFFRPFDRSHRRPAAAGDDPLDPRSRGSERGGTFRRVEHPKPAPRPGADVEEPPPAPEPPHDEIDGARDVADLAPDRGRNAP